jgi:hypothetical protein
MQQRRQQRPITSVEPHSLLAVMPENPVRRLDLPVRGSRGRAAIAGSLGQEEILTHDDHALSVYVARRLETSHRQAVADVADLGPADTGST